MRIKLYSWKDIREEFDRRARLSQRQLAKQTGFAPSYINDVAQGRRPLTETMAVMMGFTKLPDRFEFTGPILPAKRKARK